MKSKDYEKVTLPFRKEINQQKIVIAKHEKIISDLEEKVRNHQLTIDHQTDWIERLLECTEMSKDDIKTMLDNGTALAKGAVALDAISRFVGRF